MKRIGERIAAAAIVLCIAGTAIAEEGWLVDFKAAKEKAAAEGKDLFMEFTGSDWCPPCINFKKTVLDTDVFKTAAPESYILLKLDNPRDKSKQTPDEIEQYKKLSAEYKITGVPTVILADSQGRPFVKMVGYGGQPADVYVKELVAKVDIRKTRDDNLAKAEKADGIEKAKLLNEAISGVDSELALSQYRETVDQIVALDKDNEAGLKAKYEKLINQVAIRASVQDVMKTAAADPLAAAKKLDELVSEKSLEGETLQEVLFAKAQLLFRADKAQSKTTLLAAQKAAPNTQIGQQISQILAQFFADDDNKKGAGDSKDQAKTDSSVKPAAAIKKVK